MVASAKKSFVKNNYQKLPEITAVFEQLASAPSSPVEGQRYYNTTSHVPQVYNGTTWLNMTGSSGVVESIVAGTAIDVDATDPANPVVSVVIADIISDGTTSTSTTWSSTKIAAQIQASAAGLVNKGTVRATTTTALPANTYSNGTSGVGATLTGNSNGALSAQDGVTLTTGDLLLVQDEADATHNGIYSLTQVGNAGAPYILTRATNFNSATTIVPNSMVFVSEGTTYHDTAWWLENLTQPFVVGTDDIIFSQFAAGIVYTAGDGIDITGTTISAVYDNSTIGINGSNQLYVKNAGITETQIASGALSSTGGLTGGSGTKIAILPDNTTGATVVPVAVGANGAGITVDNSSLENNAGTARVKALGITNGMLAGSIADSKLNQITTANKVAGSAVQLNAAGALADSTGLIVQVDDSSIEINGSNQLGVKALGITNGMLAGSIADSKLSTIATANKVSGSAVQLNASGAIIDSTGLAVQTDSSTIGINGSNQVYIPNGGVGTNQLANASVTAAKLANKYAADFVSGDFTGGSLTIAASTHGLGATKYLTVAVYEAGTPNTLVTDGVNVTVASSGDVVISVETGLEFDGYVIIRN